MTQEELKYLRSLPSTLTIYRSHAPFNQMGYCWTLQAQVAKDFGHGYAWEGLTTAKISRACVVAYFNRRNEDEIIIRDTSALEIVGVQKLSTN